MDLNVGMGEARITDDATAQLTARDLGSAVSVVVYDAEVHVAGLLNFMLPRWQMNRKAALENPFLFANSGIPQLYRRCYDLGAQKQRMKCYLVGGADVRDGTGTFRLGEENLKVADDILSENGVKVTGRRVGGMAIRRLRHEPELGQLVVTHADGERCTL